MRKALNVGLFRKSINPADYYFDLRWPYKPKQQPDYSEESFTFRQTYLQFVQFMAKDWFGEEIITVRELFEDSSDVDVELLIPRGEDGEPSVFSDLGVSKLLLDSGRRFEHSERISWEKSKIAVRWSEKLSSLGVNLFPIPSPQNNQINIVTGPWKLFDNETPFPLFGEAWKDKRTGEEFIYWFFDALVKTRPSLQTKGLHPSYAYFIPMMFHRLGYISETIFPSSMVRMRDRQGEFAADSLEEIPSIALHTEQNYIVMSIFEEEKGITHRLDWSPETTRYGYIIDDSIPFETNAEIIPKVVDALPKAASVLMDGFCNWTDGQEISFQHELFLDVDLKGVQISPFELGLFVAGPAYGRLVWKSMVVYGALRELSNDEKILSKDPKGWEILENGYYSVIDRGCGMAPMNALNSLVFYMCRKHPDKVTQFAEDAREFPRSALRYFSRFAIDNQDANALSNLAYLEFLWGNWKESLAIADEGLANLKEDAVFYHSGLGGEDPSTTIPIRLELLITKARTHLAQGNNEEAKQLIEQVIRESRENNFSGSEFTEAQLLLSTL